jgi:ribosomal protein S18 acetylase RimI-like enzyme
MSGFVIRKAAPDDAPALARLAREIWTQHYTPLIGPEQVEYMLDKFQSAEYIQSQLGEGYVYYMAYADGEAAGYCAIRPDEAGEIFLSKIYVKKEFRGMGLARAFIDGFLEEFREGNYKKIRLTVNKGNADSIAAYKRLGFEIVYSVVSDIGEGYVMDDYIMERKL